VGYADLLRERFPDLNPVVDDLFLLEAHQIAELPHRVPASDLGAVLRAHPRLHRFLVTRCPEAREPFDQMLAHQPDVAVDDVAACEQAVVWEIADWIVYQRAPQDYDTHAGVDWSIAAVTQVTRLTDKVVIDAGAGTGRVAFDAAPMARHVFAVEPVATLRQFIRDRAARRQVHNLFVLDGFLHAIPLPTSSTDVLLTCQAVGWNLPEEIAEIERVVTPGGVAMHLFGTPDVAQPHHPLSQALQQHGYHPRTYRDGALTVHSYHKTIGT
jgi:SAM-dependent methyltransferase